MTQDTSHLSGRVGLFLTTLLGLAALMVAPLTAIAPPAEAAGIILTTNGDGTGYGEAGGRITFPSRYKVKIVEPWANDYCGPRGGDGRGVYMRGKATTRSGTGKWRKHRLGLIAYDNNGCGSTPMRFDTRRWTKSSKIVYVELWLCEENHSASGTKCLRRSSIKTYRNPHQ
ncbi:hypothetical protein [Nocardioides donggukensis]|uniref:Uncharacterized protein n=1 Tax=Nocardioides donggukensis TaxID=2774019 RepID=A0A927PZH4_9ACTN|nr:hypothetical protein [Nocardioides donggukensis]MBD8869130.1 hypothetical protein [Nocardioides donggukensis]